MPVASSTFRWTEVYSVKIALLDEQDQKLFDTVNELDRALRTGGGNSVIDPVVGKLLDYARVHFAEEESLMEKHNFPGRTLIELSTNHSAAKSRSFWKSTKLPGLAFRSRFCFLCRHG